MQQLLTRYGEIELKALIRKLPAQNISLILSTHSLAILEDLTEIVWFMKDGMLYQDEVLKEGLLAYCIDVDYTGDLHVLLQQGGLEATIEGQSIMTPAGQPVEPYLQHLLAAAVVIRSVQPIKRNLEAFYKSFYHK